MAALSAYDALWQTTAEFYSSIGEVPVIDVAADPSAVFRASGLEPDAAQLELLACKARNILVLWTRQFAGKSQTAAALALHEAMTNLGKHGNGSLTLIFSAGQREAIELLRKVRFLRYGLMNQRVPAGSKFRRLKSAAKDVKRYQKLIGKTGWDEPKLPDFIDAAVDAKTMIELANGSRIVSLPAKSQATVGYTADLLILDEAKVIPDDLFRSVRPMLATTGGRMVALSTPLGQRGWFYEACKQCEEAAAKGEKAPYALFKRTAYDCPRVDLEFLEQERRMIGDYWFDQEYMVKFLAPTGSVFRTEDVERMLRSAEEPYKLPWV